MPFTPKLIDRLVNSLDKYKSNEMLAKIYQWPIDNAAKKLAEFDAESASNIKGNNLFEKTVSVRNIVQEKLLAKNISEKENNKYIFWIIKDWGGIRTGGRENLLQIISEIEKTSFFHYKNIASWSKYFAFKYPEKYAIYDARVIYTLNWFLFKAGSDKFFPTPSGRNSLMNALDYKTMLLVKTLGINKVKSQIEDDIKNREKKPGTKSRTITTLNKNLYIKNDFAYLDYCALLKDLSTKLFSNTDLHGLTKTEMILFAIADKDIVIDVLQHQH